MSKVILADEATKLVKDGDSVTGFGFSFMAPEELFIALENSFLETGHPRDLTLVIPGGAGNLRGAGFDHFAHEGFVKKIIGPYFNLTRKLGQMILEEKVECYMLPAGVLAQILRDIGAKRPGLITHVGLKTYVDPRVDGAKINAISKEDYVELIEIDGKEWLRYKPFPIDVAMLKASTADEFGNLTLEKEAGLLVSTSMAIAAHNCGGKVIAQVERVASVGTLNPQHVVVPGTTVDAIVIAKPEHHWMTWREQYNPARSGEVRIADIGLPPVLMGLEKVVARRALYEIEPGKVVNLGAGMSEYISSLAWEEKIFDKIILTVEAGMIGGIPGYGLQFNTASNPYAIIDQTFQMDLYDGGGNDISCVGFAQINKEGNVNVSKIAGRLTGVGGFLNVCPMAKKRVHVGSFTAGKSDIRIEDGKLNIVKDGDIIKFVDKVDHVTLSGEFALDVGQPVIIITERCVFDWGKDGFIIKEIAPGVDLEKHILKKMEFEPKIFDDLKYMPEELFKEEPLNLKEKEPWKGYTLF
jgi:propionate CoA-transferase